MPLTKNEDCGKNLDGSIEAGTDASKAIMTTDTVNKEVAVSFDIAGKKVIKVGK